MNFLNSKEWRKFQESVGRKTFFAGGAVPASGMGPASGWDGLGEGFMVKMDMPFGKNYLYSNYHDAPKFVDEIKKVGQKEGSIFFKWEPLIMEHGTWNMEQLKTQGFRKAVKALQPQKTVILNLKKTEEELLDGMHSKTRYNIRLAQRHKVQVKKTEDFEIFWQLLQKTTQRDKFLSHPKNYYKKLLEVNGTYLFVAYYKAQPAAAAIVIFYNPHSHDYVCVKCQRLKVKCVAQATYLHGASDYSLRKYMAPYILHWEIIKQAKKEGLNEYDFWGIDEGRWPGVTRFKRGFGGKEVQYIGSFDLVFKPMWYEAYKVKNYIKSNK